MLQTKANDRQVGGNHYKGGIQHWDYIISNEIPYMEAQIIKYVTRWRDKNGIEDLRKAHHFLEKLIEVEASKFKVDEEVQEDNERIYNQNLDK